MVTGTLPVFYVSKFDLEEAIWLQTVSFPKLEYFKTLDTSCHLLTETSITTSRSGQKPNTLCDEDFPEVVKTTSCAYSLKYMVTD